MSRHPHLILRGTGETKGYTSPRQVVARQFPTPPRDDRRGHGERIVSSIRAAVDAADVERADEEKRQGFTLEFESDQGFALKLESLENARSGIELVNVREENGRMFATVFVPTEKVSILLRKFEQYIDKDTKSGAPRNRALVESISLVRRAALRSFWMDSKPFPTETGRIWWEVWLRNDGGITSVVEKFRAEAQRVGIDVGHRLVRFPERIVILAEASLDQWDRFRNLFDLLAELRAAAIVPTDFVELTPQEQADRIASALRRITPPGGDAPAVCLLDTGVNRNHPLLEIALEHEHVLTIDPAWSTR